jgi:hypothetical protein
MISQIFIKVGNWAIDMFFELIKTSAVFVIGVIASIVGAIITLILSVVLYILQAIGVMRIAKKLGVGHRWLAWIPIAKAYLIGDCAEASIARNGKKPAKWGMIILFSYMAVTVGKTLVQMLLLTIGNILPGLNALIVLVLELAPFIFVGLYTYCMYRIFKEFTGKTGGIILSICALLSVNYEGLFFFIASFFKLRGSEDEQQTEAAEVAELVEATAPVQNAEAYEDPFAV